ncbi:MAG: S-methyl-5'-thioadenosine phosphorylase [Candidatus Bathyarchaeota archaeon]|nr:S-methyl-5'-thioadenosine phosphorylase [Candidatus Bathyarchaeota archaeon]
MLDNSRADIAVIGGTGVYESDILEERLDVKIHTPYGSPSDVITLGLLKGRRVAFLSRHGRSHAIPPHNLPSRANIWALKSLGVKQIIASSAVGSLRQDYKPGDFVLTDQFIDRTKGRPDTFYEGGQICHISAADPICPTLHDSIIYYAKKIGIPIHTSGTYVCVNGPRFSTRAESKLFKQWGCDLVGMTLYPECILAREAEICYASVAMVTDYDVWAEKPVSTLEVMDVMKRNAKQFKKLVMGTLSELETFDNCTCRIALKNSLI